MGWKELSRWLRWGIICSIVFLIIGVFFIITSQGPIGSFVIELLVWIMLGFLIGIFWGSGKGKITKLKSFFIGFLFLLVALIFSAKFNSIEQLLFVIGYLVNIDSWGSESPGSLLVYPVIFGLIFLFTGWLIQKIKSKKEENNKG
ncbi:MAG: hypothetical protein AABX17_01620 [Nanoarchaeota archaeon]